MVDSSSVNGATALVAPVQALPDVLHISTAESNRVPSPGTQRALRAETGRGWDDLMGPDADTADRFQTLIWMKLRRDRPDLTWDDCAEIEIEIDDLTAPPDPTKASASDPSPDSVGSGA